MTHNASTEFIRLSWANPKPGMAESVIVAVNEDLMQYMRTADGCGEMSIATMTEAECKQAVHDRVWPAKTSGMVELDSPEAKSGNWK